MNASNSIFIGPYSGTSRPYTLWIDTMATNNNYYLPLLYGEFDNRTFDVNGKLTASNIVATGTITATNGAASYRTVEWTASDLGTNGFAHWRSNNAIWISIYVQGGGYVTNKNLIPDF